METDNLKEARRKDDCHQKTSEAVDCGVRKSKSAIPGFNQKQTRFSLWYILFVSLVMVLYSAFYSSGPWTREIEFSEFKKRIAGGDIQRVEINNRYYVGYPIKRDKTNENGRLADSRPEILKTVPVQDPSFIPLLDSLGVVYYARQSEENPLTGLLFNWVLPLGLMFAIWGFVFRRMGKLGAGVMSFGDSKAQLVAEGDIKTRFSDVAGVDEVKEELSEIVDFLKQPERYTEVGGKIPKGVLLVGPPGTGKTLCARAVAGEAGVPFFKISGADFVEMFVGVGASRVRDLFRQARQKAPCIVFIDELDAIGKARGKVAIGGHDEREQTLNQLLVEMDGFESRSGVIILAATNRPETLDPALLRPGRFDRQILVDKPDLKGREDILNRHIEGVSLGQSVNLHDIAARTAGFAGADLANLVNEAALLAVRRNRKAVEQQDFEGAIEKLIAGLEKKNRLINPREREIVAVHETGHALMASLTTGADPVHKITIVPRGLGALGYTMQVPTEDRFLMSERELLGRIDVLLGGRAAEELVFQEISTGAANDLAKATDIARKMVTDYGMSEKFRNVVFEFRRGPDFLGHGTEGLSREYSEETARYIDEAVAAIIDKRYKRVLSALKRNVHLLRKIADLLLRQESLDGATFSELVKAMVPDEEMPQDMVAADSTV